MYVFLVTQLASLCFHPTEMMVEIRLVGTDKWFDTSWKVEVTKISHWKWFVDWHRQRKHFTSPLHSHDGATAIYVHALGYGRHGCACIICFWKGSPFYMPCLAQVTLSQTGYKQGKIFLFRLLSEWPSDELTCLCCASHWVDSVERSRKSFVCWAHRRATASGAACWSSPVVGWSLWGRA